MEDSFTFSQNSPRYMTTANNQAYKHYFPTIPLEEEDWEQFVIEEMFGYGEFGEEYPYFNLDYVFDFEEEDQEWGIQ